MEKRIQLLPTATESDTKPGKVTTSIFLTCIGQKGREIYSTFVFGSPQDEIILEIVLTEFDGYCKPRKNLTTRHRFFTCKQAENKIINDYVTELRHKAKESELGNITDSLIHVLICGIKDSRLRENLFMQPDLTLAKTIQAGQSAKETNRYAKILDTTSEQKHSEIANIKSSKHHEKNGEKI